MQVGVLKDKTIANFSSGVFDPEKDRTLANFFQAVSVLRRTGCSPIFFLAFFGPVPRVMLRGGVPQ